MIEYIERKTGVGAVVINPNGEFLAVQEKNFRKDNRKLRGMWSIPMETVDGEESHEEAIRRLLFNEEVKGIEVEESSLTDIYLGKVQLSEGVWLYNYLLHTGGNDFMQGDAPDVTGIRWANVGEPVNANTYRLSNRGIDLLPSFLDATTKEWISQYLRGLEQGVRMSLGSLEWRPGVREVMSAYLEYLMDPQLFRPMVHTKTIDDFPQEIILEDYKGSSEIHESHE